MRKLNGRAAGGCSRWPRRRLGPSPRRSCAVRAGGLLDVSPRPRGGAVSIGHRPSSLAERQQRLDAGQATNSLHDLGSANEQQPKAVPARTRTGVEEHPQARAIHEVQPAEVQDELAAPGTALPHDGGKVVSGREIKLAQEPHDHSLVVTFGEDRESRAHSFRWFCPARASHP